MRSHEPAKTYYIGVVGRLIGLAAGAAATWAFVIPILGREKLLELGLAFFFLAVIGIEIAHWITTRLVHR